MGKSSKPTSASKSVIISEPELIYDTGFSVMYGVCIYPEHGDSKLEAKVGRFLLELVKEEID